VISHEEINHQGVANHDSVVVHAATIEHHHGDPEQVDQLVSHECWTIFSNEGVENNFMDIHLRQIISHYFFYENLDFVWGVE
jgi:hypothetical protein